MFLLYTEDNADWSNHKGLLLPQYTGENLNFTLYVLDFDAVVNNVLKFYEMEACSLTSKTICMDEGSLDDVKDWC